MERSVAVAGDLMRPEAARVQAGAVLFFRRLIAFLRNDLDVVQSIVAVVDFRRDLIPNFHAGSA